MTNKNNHPTQNPPQKVRADKWLWAARFFKTRTLAKDAIESGKVHINGTKIKIHKLLQVGDVLHIRQGYTTKQDEKVIVVDRLSEHRGNASVAQTLYHETEESMKRRDCFAKQHKLNNLARSDTKPSKKDRRDLAKFKEGL